MYGYIYHNVRLHLLREGFNQWLRLKKNIERLRKNGGMDTLKLDRGIISRYHSKRLECKWSNRKTKMEGINKAAQSPIRRGRVEVIESENQNGGNQQSSAISHSLRRAPYRYWQNVCFGSLNLHAIWVLEPSDRYFFKSLQIRVDN